MNNQAYQFVVRKGPKPGQVFALETDLINIGRDPLSDIVIDDPEVSRHHARLTQTEDGYLLQDRGSTNGSFVDDERLGGEPVLLQPGQVVKFGTTVTLVYQAIQEEDPMATVVAPVPAVVLEEEEPAPLADDSLEELADEPEIEPAPEPLSEVEEEAVGVEEEPVVEAEPAFEFDEPDLDVSAEVAAEAGVVESIEVDLVEEPEEESVSQDLIEEEDDDAMATMIEPSPPPSVEEPVEPDPLPTFDEPQQELPEVPTPEEASQEIELPAEPPSLEPLPSFEEPSPESMPEPSEKVPAYDMAEEQPEAIVDSGAPVMDFGEGIKESSPIEASGEIVDDEKPVKRNRNIIIGVVAFLVLCCLCLIVGAVIYFIPLAGTIN